MKTGFVACAILVLASCASVPAGKVRPTSKPDSDFALLRQMQGGDFVSDPELVQYVRSVGSKLARASGDERSFEIAVIDGSSRESWSLPGGKVAVTRGLLQEIRCETQLAEALAIEMGASYSNARPASDAVPTKPGNSAKAASGTEPRSNTQAGYGASPGRSSQEAHDPEVLPVGIALAAARQGTRSFDAALEARIRSEAASMLDRAGYTRGRSTARACARYERATRALHAADDAYLSYESGVAALRKHDLPSAQAHANAALLGLPNDAKAHELLGDIARERGELRSALAYYETAIALNPSHYRPRLQAGLVLYRLKEPDRAVGLLARSIESLPTAPAAYHLGLIAREAYDVQQAIQYFQLAASSDSPVGRSAARALVQLDLERNPERYVDVEPRVDSAGNVWMVVSNHAPLTVESVVVEAAVTRMEGGVAEGPVRLSTGGQTLPPEGVAQLPTSLGPLANPRAIRLVRAEVQAAEAAR